MTSNESDFRQKISEFRRQNRKEFRTDAMEFAPFRTIDDFILNTDRFKLPKFDDEERWFNRMIYNLMYYQSNYLMSAIVIFMLVFSWRPQEMMAGILIMIFVFGLMSTLARRRIAIRDFQRQHPLLVTLIVLLIGHWLIYKLASILVILLGLLLPISFMIIHASCRMRNIANKLTNAAQVMGFKNITPMGYLLESIGIEPNFKYN